jgi:hypothetical protein
MEGSSDATADPIWSDAPRTAAEDDRLDRIPFAKMVATQVNRVVPRQESVVFGVVGPWGSGKTTLLSLVERALPRDWKVARFSPWAAPNQAGLHIEFLSTLVSVLDRKDEVADKAKNAVAKYSKFATPLLSLIPVAGSATQKSVESLIDAYTAAPPWHAEFEETASALRELGYRVLIIADDIDRLDASELLELLKIVRLLGRFPNVHYLLAYDQGTVEDLLASQGIPGRSSTFMEKIVQHPFEVPPMALAVRRRLVTETLDALLQIAKWDREDDDANSRASELLGIFAEGLETPRSIARLGEQLCSYAGMVQFDEIDVLDFAALSFVRLFSHDLWDQLRGWREELLSGHRHVGLAESKEISQPEWEDRISRSVRHVSPTSMQKAMSFLFPTISAKGLSYFAEHSRAFASERYFERYLVLGVPEDDVADRVVTDGLRALISGAHDSLDIEALLNALDDPDDGRAAIAYEKCLEERRRDKLGSAPIVEFLRDRLEARLSESPSFGNPRAVLQRWLPRELYWALSANKIDPDRVLALFRLEDVLANLLLMGRLDLPAERVREVRGPFADYFAQRIRDDFESVVSQEGLLRLLTSLVVSTWDAGRAAGLLDPLIRNDIDTYMRVATAFVQVREWVGGNESEYDLAFDEKLFALAVSKSLRSALSEQLPSEPSSRIVDSGETSPEGKKRFALSWLRALD